MTDFTDFGDYGFNRIIKYNGLVDFDGLYKFIQTWLRDRQWDFMELQAKDKPPWKVYKWQARRKMTFYGALQINMEIWLWEPKEVVVVRQGKEKHLLDTRMKINIGGAQVTDYDGDFEKGEFLKKVERFLNKYVMYHENLLKYFDYLDYYLHDFMTQIKQYLEMETATNAY